MSDVDSFDEQTVVVFTDMGGSLLCAARYFAHQPPERGGRRIADWRGHISSLTYTDEPQGRAAGSSVRCSADMYMLTIADQTRLFLLALGLGFLLGIVYDLFRVVRMAFTMRRVGVFIQDVLFFLTCAAATFLFLLAVNQGEIRGFIIAGEGLGFLIYYFSFGLLAVRVSSFLVHAIHRLFFVISVPFSRSFFAS
mgnify:CR=1 FL=1